MARRNKGVGLHIAKKGGEMALISCFECGNKILSTARVCSHCGIENPYEKGLEHWEKD